MKRLALLLLVLVLVGSFFAVQSSAKAAPAQDNTGLTAMVLASQLRVRTGPGVNHGILTWVDWGAILVVEGRNAYATWYKVITPDGTEGWVSAFWVRLSRNVARSSLPIVS